MTPTYYARIITYRRRRRLNVVVAWCETATIRCQWLLLASQKVANTGGVRRDAGMAGTSRFSAGIRFVRSRTKPFTVQLLNWLSVFARNYRQALVVAIRLSLWQAGQPTAGAWYMLLRRLVALAPWLLLRQQVVTAGCGQQASWRPVAQVGAQQVRRQNTGGIGMVANTPLAVLVLGTPCRIVSHRMPPARIDGARCRVVRCLEG